MGLRIQTNVNSLFAQRNLALTTSRLNTSNERLASGYRINKAADDAAGLAISEKMRAGIRGMNQAKRNALDGISMVQTAEGGLQEISNIVVRLKELAVQAASDTIGATERGYLQMEFGSLKDEIDRIARSSEFNGLPLLLGDPRASLNGEPNLMISEQSKDRQGKLPSEPIEIQVGPNYHEFIDGLDQINPVNVIRVDLTKFNALTEGENSLGIGHSRSENGTRIDKKEEAQNSINRLDGALSHIAEFRASLGAIQNRLQSAINNLGINIENTSASMSRIKDTDFAEESAKVAQQSILQQAGISVLMQANQMPNLALKLLSA